MGPEAALADRPGTHRDPGIAAQLADSASRENFPVALRLLPREHRAELLALYAFARTVDDLGDGPPPSEPPERVPPGGGALIGSRGRPLDGTGPRDARGRRAATPAPPDGGDRVARLRALRAAIVETERSDAAPTNDAAADRARDLLGEALWATAVTPILEVLRRRSLDASPLVDLVDANLRDQVQHRYDCFEDLLDYCTQSANPVGRLVLGIFELDSPLARGYSDQICSALQVIEHLQDIREDRLRGRTYLPRADLARFGVREEVLADTAAASSLRRLVAWEASRAAALLEAGTPLVAIARGPARRALAGFVAGGRATLEAIADAGYDTLARQVRPSTVAVARHAASLVVAPRRAWRLA